MDSLKTRRATSLSTLDATFICEVSARGPSTDRRGSRRSRFPAADQTRRSHGCVSLAREATRADRGDPNAPRHPRRYPRCRDSDTATDRAYAPPYAAALASTTHAVARLAPSRPSRARATRKPALARAGVSGEGLPSEPLARERVSSALASGARLAAAAAAATTLALSGVDPAFAELNAREAARGGEFNRGSAQQFGGYDLTNTDVVAKYGEDLRLSNFTGAEMRKAKLRGANLTGAYLMKAVAFAADFEGANLSDALMDRAVLNNANFKDAILTRVVLTSSDLGDATIEGADFSDALIDVGQKNALCKYASGVNSVTGVATRKSLNCGGSGRTSTPSRYMTDDTAQKPEPAFEASRFSMY